MALPTIRATATIALPRRGRHGILWSSTQNDEGGRVPSEESTQSTLPWLTSLVGLPGLPESVEQLAAAEAAKVVTKPLTARSSARRDRRRHQEEELAEARRALLWKTPGDWDASVFCGIRQRLLEAGRWEAVSGLNTVAAQMSEIALCAGSYRVLRPRPHNVQLPGAPYGAQWIGAQSMPSIDTGMETRQVPPIVCTHLSPLEAVIQLRGIYPHHLLVMSFEATDFSEDGSGVVLGSVDSRGAAQQEVFLRTSLHYNNKAAAVLCRGGVTPQGLLTSQTNPYVYAAPRVTIFRGPADKGYPFFDAHEQTVVNMLVSGRSSQRPMMSKHGEYFSEKEDVQALVERLQLLAHAAVDPEIMQVDGRTDVDLHLAQGRKPVLVIAANDLAYAGAPQPRHSIALALKSWRQLHCTKFAAVVVAGGERSTAQIMDKFVNFDVYASTLQDRPFSCDWPWDPALLQLSVNRTLLNIGARRQPPRAELGLERGGGEGAAPEAAPGPQAPRSPAAGARPAALAAPAETPRRPWSQRATGMDSRTAHEIALANRMADRYIHDPIADAKRRLDKSKADTSSAGTAGVKTIASYQNKQEREAQNKMLRDKIENLADSLEMPEELKVHVVATICDDKMLARQGKSVRQDSGEAPPLQNELKQIAGELDARLQQRRMELPSARRGEALPGDVQEVPADDLSGPPAIPDNKSDLLPKIGRILQTGGRSVTNNLILQHEALNITAGPTDLA